jgi:hypothetical protein
MNSGETWIDVSGLQHSKHSNVTSEAIRHTLSALDPRIRSDPSVDRWSKRLDIFLITLNNDKLEAALRLEDLPAETPGTRDDSQGRTIQR